MAANYLTPKPWKTQLMVLSKSELTKDTIKIVTEPKYVTDSKVLKLLGI